MDPTSSIDPMAMASKVNTPSQPAASASAASPAAVLGSPEVMTMPHCTRPWWPSGLPAATGRSPSGRRGRPPQPAAIVLRLYGFNIMLLAVNTAGVVKSIGQAIGGQKVAFARTPKVRDRTIAPALFVAVPFVVAAWSAATLASDVADRAYLHAGFAGVNAVLTLYVMLALHGLRNSVGDVVHDLGARLYRPAPAGTPRPADPDWVTVLYHGVPATGEARNAAGPAMAGALAAIDQERSSTSQIMLLSPPAVAGIPSEDPGADFDGDDLSAAGSLERAQADALAQALAQRLRALKPGDRLVLRMSRSSLELGLDDAAAQPAGAH